MTAIRFDEYDRDDDGKLIVDPAEAAARRAPVLEAVSLRDLLPATPAAAAAPVRATHAPRTWLTVALAAVVTGIALAVLMRFAPWAHVTPRTQPTAVATVAPTAAQSAGAVQPTHAPAQILARWDYRDRRNVTSITPDMIAGVAGTADDGAWVLVDLTNGRRVWLRSADAPAAPASAPDMTVPTAGPIVVEVPVPVAAPAPPQVCGEYGVPGKMVTACGSTQQEADAAGQDLWKRTYAR